MHRDLVAGNSASQDGGGIEFEPQSPSTSTISDTTIAENSSVGAGGGVDELNSSTETLELFNDSLVANTASQGGDFRAWSNTTIAFRNTLFAESSAPSGPTCEYGGGATVTSLGHNLQDVNDENCHFGATDKANVAPNLGTLQNNGGPTDTMLPAPGSPLIDAGDTAHCTAQDQRGVPRPQGLGCDIGAVERTTPTAGTPLGSLPPAPPLPHPREQSSWVVASATATVRPLRTASVRRWDRCFPVSGENRWRRH
jgi:hypothetical protein